MDAPDLKLSCTAVRIPTLRAHSEAITLETEQKISAADVREMLRSAPGVKVVGT
jgi:aspartate-semialdehyde dehydrogenase